MAVTKDQDSADELMSSSPQKYSIELPRRAQDMRFMDLKRPNMVDTTRASILPSDGATPSGESQQQQQQQEFVLRIFPPVDYTHGGTMESSPLHGPWPTSYTAEDSHTSAILRQTLPHTTAAAGLARWDYNLELYNGRMSPKAARLLVAGWMPGNMAKQQQQEQASPDGHDQQEKKAHRLS